MTGVFETDCSNDDSQISSMNGASFSRLWNMLFWRGLHHSGECGGTPIQPSAVGLPKPTTSAFFQGGFVMALQPVAAGCGETTPVNYFSIPWSLQICHQFWLRGLVGGNWACLLLATSRPPAALPMSVGARRARAVLIYQTMNVVSGCQRAMSSFFLEQTGALIWDTLVSDIGTSVKRSSRPGHQT